jgi:hypothetical protein
MTAKNYVESPKFHNSQLLKDVFNYLVNNQICKVHKIQHTGRFGYALLISLTSGSEIGTSKSIDKKLFKLLLSNVLKDNRGYFLSPGTRHRRNYSTDAIDIGIAIDVLSLYLEKYKVSKKELNLLRNLVDTTLIELVQKSNISNQRLWATLGLAHFYKNAPIHLEQKIVYKKLILESIDTFLDSVADDGYSPYFGKNQSLNGHSPYYHSRCLAFTILSLELIGVNPGTKRLAKIRAAYLYMLRISNHDATRNSLIDSKRYYFLGGEEYFSLIFDLYVTNHPITQGFTNTSSEKYSKNLNNLILSTIDFSKIILSSRSELKSSNWQCNYMGISYLAWLTRINAPTTRPFKHNKFDGVAVDPITLNASIYSCSHGDSYKYHFVSKKAPLNLHTGGKVSGIILSNSDLNPFDMSGLPLSHYSYFQVNRSNVRFVTNMVVKDIKWLKLFFHEFMIVNKFFDKFLKLCKSLVSFFIAGFTYTTSFNTSVEILEIGSNFIVHVLAFSRLDGVSPQAFGIREITFAPEGILVRDTIDTKLLKLIDTKKMKLAKLQKGKPFVFKTSSITPGDTYRSDSDIGLLQVDFI